MPKLLALAATIVTTTALLVSGVVAAGGLTESARLSAVYDTILQARISTARSQLARTCPPAPREACLALEASAIWWQIQIDPDSRSLDQQIEETSRSAIAAAEAWTKREPQRAEAWFYLAGAYAPLSQWRVLRGQRMPAARDGVRVKEALERALALDPTLKDAYFGIGLYHYIADVIPAPLKLLRFLLLMPGGDRAAGLREMLTAREQGVLLGGEADYQLHFIYLWYEHDTLRALELLRGLAMRYPSNPIFEQRIADIHRDYQHDRSASRDAWQRLLDRARSSRVEFAPITAVRARLELADDLIELGDIARAENVLQPIVDEHAVAPYGAEARAQFTLGRVFAAQHRVDRAIQAFDRAIAIAPNDDPHAIKRRAREARAQVAKENIVR